MRRIVNVTVFVALTTGALAEDVDLDKSVVRTPTVRSEIKKGNENAFSCFFGTQNIDANKYAKCVDDKRVADAVSAPSSAYYLFGLYAAAIPLLKGKLEPGMARFIEKYEIKWATSRLEDWEKTFQQLSAETKVTISDYCKAISADDVSKCSKGHF